MTTVQLPDHIHMDADENQVAHSHADGHIAHRHPVDGPNEALPSAVGEQYDVPRFLVKTTGESALPGVAVVVVCSMVAWQGNYLRYMPARGWDKANGRTWLTVALANLNSVEELEASSLVPSTSPAVTFP